VNAQTNLQLYRQLIEAQWDEAALLMIRNGYELAVQLFADAYRASRRPFVAHLVGTASVLASWQQRPALVAAGLLHSAYLYGYFGDGQKGMTAARRQVLASAVGKQAEQLVCEYTLICEDKLVRFCETTTLTPQERDVATLQLANLYDDCRDGEPVIATTKRRPLDLPWSAAGRQAVGQLAERVVGPLAAAALHEQFQQLDALGVPACLKVEKRLPRRITPGVAELRQPAIQRYLRRAFQFLDKKRAA
jgi:hypothetical protein